MNIRSARNDDLDALVQLFTRAVHIGAADAYDAAQRSAWAPIPPDLDRWRARFRTLNTLVAEHESQLLGFIAFDCDGHIDLLFVDPAHVRAGVAAALYQEAEAMLVTRGVEEILTEASLLAEPFFRRRGFAVEEREDVLRNGVALTRFRMRKRFIES